MVGARSLAMALNRLIDADIDAQNPRTASREIPSGRLRVGQVAGFCVVSLAVLLLAVSQLPEETWVLWPVPVVAFVLYPLAKRVTWACHLALGLTIGIAPMGAWLAVTGDLGPAPIMLGLGVAVWIAGFDVIYALLDVEFDRANDVHSVPSALARRARCGSPGSCTSRRSRSWPAPAPRPAPALPASWVSVSAPSCCCWWRTRSCGPVTRAGSRPRSPSRTACWPSSSWSSPWPR